MEDVLSATERVVIGEEGDGGVAEVTKEFVGVNGDFSAGLTVVAPVVETSVVEAVTSLMVGVRLGLKVASKNGRDDFFKTE